MFGLLFLRGIIGLLIVIMLYYALVPKEVRKVNKLTRELGDLQLGNRLKEQIASLKDAITKEKG
ncbi:MAG: hypothetical protein HOG49_28695 [Candidatus Scalindua sp.]|jgi:hypothetical protein|nr:hypothetical protein [Candidatus Scalindua sp.]